MLSTRRTSRTLEYRKTKYNLLANVFLTALVLCLLVGCYQIVAHHVFHEDTALFAHSRLLLGSCDDSGGYEIEGSNYPDDVFTEVWCALLYNLIVFGLQSLAKSHCKSNQN